jgi:hypothetical protein
MPKALRAEINDVVVKYTERKLRNDGTLDVAVIAHEMTQSLVDMIVDQDEHHHAPLLALMILSLGDEYLQRTGIGERRDNLDELPEVLSNVQTVLNRRGEEPRKRGRSP